MSTVAAAALLCSVGAGTAQAAPPRPDLVVTGITWAPSTPTTGDRLLFTATIKNQGKAATPAGVIHGVGFQVDGKLVTWSDTRTTSLKPGQSATVTANFGPTSSSTWAATTGRHELLAFVDDAARIAESNEGNNRTKTTLNVSAPALQTTVDGHTATTTLAPLNQPTGLATYVTGTAYGACFYRDALTGKPLVREGTEQALGTYSAGNSGWHQDRPFASSGTVDVPAGTTKTSTIVDTGSILKYSYGAPEVITCQAGDYPSWSSLHATKVTTNRYAVAADGWSQGALLATYIASIDTSLQL